MHKHETNKTKQTHQPPNTHKNTIQNKTPKQNTKQNKHKQNKQNILMPPKNTQHRNVTYEQQQITNTQQHNKRQT